MSAAYDTAIANLATAMSCANDPITVATTLLARRMTAMQAWAAAGTTPTLAQRTAVIVTMQVVASEIFQREAHDATAATQGASALVEAAAYLAPS